MKYNVTLKRGARLIVVGDIHEHEEQFDKLLSEITPSEDVILAFVGDVYDKGFGRVVAESITDKIRELVEDGFTYAIRGNHELSSIRRYKKKKKMTEQLKWWARQPLSLSFTFSNRAKVTVVHGGVLPSHTWEDLASSIDVCYVRDVDKDGKIVKRLKKEKDGMRIMENAKPGTSWHELYDGRFGYIVSGHSSQKDGIPKFYNYSCNLDTAIYHTGKLTAQVFADGAREKLLTFTGTPKYPDLNEMFRRMAKGRI
jgi:predicted MPP superfamily phosphohydrolase